MGLPGMCGFVGEFFVVLATWNFSPVFSLLAALTVVITAAYILWTLQRVFLGVNPAYKSFPDINWRELACIVPLVILAATCRSGTSTCRPAPRGRTGGSR